MQQIAGETGVDISQFNPGQQSIAPSLVDEVAYFKPVNEAQSSGKKKQEVAAQKEITGAFERITGHKPGDKSDVNLSLNRTRYHIQNEMEARGRESGQMVDSSACVK